MWNYSLLRYVKPKEKSKVCVLENYEGKIVMQYVHVCVCVCVCVCVIEAKTKWKIINCDR